MAETKTDKFVRLAGQRVPRAADAIRLIGQLGSANYEAPEGAVDEINTYLRASVADAMKSLGLKLPKTENGEPTPPDYGGPEWALVSEAIEMLGLGHVDIAKQKLKAAMSF